MGLSLIVGAYGLAAIWSEPGDWHYQELDLKFDAINGALEVAGLPEHQEPRDPKDWDPWLCRVGAEYELDLLKRVAAHLGMSGALPPPFAGEHEPGDDPVLRSWYSRSLTDHPFEHLIRCGEGAYVPIDFPTPIIEPELALGSTQRLYADCLRLRVALGIPEAATVDDLSEWAGEENPRPWQRYEDEAYTCLALLRACEVSLATGCAILF